MLSTALSGKKKLIVWFEFVWISAKLSFYSAINTKLEVSLEAVVPEEVLMQSFIITPVSFFVLFIYI